MTQNHFDPPIVVAAYKLCLNFAPLCLRFPKIYRYSLGQTIEEHIHLLLRAVFEANSLPRPLREAPVIKANSHCELLKLLIRLTFELQVIDSTQYFQLIAQLREIGKMIGGWIKYLRQGKSENTDWHCKE